MSIHPAFPPSADESTFPEVDAFSNQDIWCEGISSMERVGPCRRFKFMVIDRSMSNGQPHRIVVARLVMPAEALMGLSRALLVDERQSGASIDYRRPLNASAH